MPRLSDEDIHRADDVVRRVRELDERGRHAIDVVLPALRDLLEAPVTAAYRLTITSNGRARYEYVKSSGLQSPHDMAHALEDRYLDRMASRRGFFDPLHPQRRQRNRVVALPWRSWCRGSEPGEVEREMSSAARTLGLGRSDVPEAATTFWELEFAFRRIGLRACNQLRVLLCDGDTLLSWVGALQRDDISHRQRLLLQRIAKPLRERLIVERRTGGGGLGHAAMVAALEHVPAAAFVLDGAGRVLHANVVGRHRLEVQGDPVRGALAQAVRGDSVGPELVMTKLTGAGLPVRYLAICGTRDDRVRFGIERARARWQLTGREVEVLAELASGRTNRDIAERLGAAPRTVELHVSSLLHKAHCDSRAQLIIDLWHLADAA